MKPGNYNVAPVNANPKAAQSKASMREEVNEEESGCACMTKSTLKLTH
jgi:hypothetical protein